MRGLLCEAVQVLLSDLRTQVTLQLVGHSCVRSDSLLICINVFLIFLAALMKGAGISL